jgi:hypothetical protein
MVPFYNHLADFMIYLSSASVFVIVVVGAVIVANVIVPIAVVALAFVLRRPLIHLSLQLVVASCFTSVAGIFPAHPPLADYCVRGALPWWSGR